MSRKIQRLKQDSDRREHGHIIMEGTPNRAIRKIPKESPEYPQRLKKLSGMPGSLYVIGNLPKDEQPTVAVVGARMCTSYGKKQAFRFAEELSAAGVQVISGLALGIDAQGHRGAIQAGNPTYAVLGCGIDIQYPAANRELYQEILDTGGGILSELPPGTPPRAGYFPARNRIISALSDVVLVVEARCKSGSLITAGFALDQGKTVYALPGQVDQSLSAGCNRLIYDGAGIALSPEILLEEWGITAEKQGKPKGKKNLGLARDLELVYSCLDLRPENLDYFMKKTGFSPGKTGSLLTQLQILGLAREVGRQHYVRQE